jgi:hypothetical protein
MPKLTLTISPKVLALLRYLAERGLCGRNYKEAAQRVLEHKLESMIRDGIIPREVLESRRPRPSQRPRPKK